MAFAARKTVEKDQYYIGANMHPEITGNRQSCLSAVNMRDRKAIS